ncbi:MAG: tetratricopeptide repeat protein [Candidatus Aminicenantia bacterium]
MKVKYLIVFLVTLYLVACASSAKKMAQQREKDFQHQYNVGLFHLNEGNALQSINYLKKSIKLNPRFYLAYNALGLAYTMQGDLKKALAYFEKCLQINPNFTEVHNNLGIIYQEMGFLDKAREEYLKVANDPRYPARESAYYNLALLVILQGKYQQALEYANSALKENRRYAMGYNIKGHILEKMGNLEEAIRNYQQAVNIVPDEIRFRFNLGVAYFHQKNYQKAEEVFEDILTKPVPPEIKQNIKEYLNKIKEKTEKNL